MNIKPKVILKWTGIVLASLAGLAVLAFAVFLIYSTVKDFKPEAIQKIAMETKAPDTIPVGKLEFYTYNIGYAGLGQKMDFFYDGGTKVMPDRAYYERCRDGVIYQMTTVNKMDFLLLQEVDQDAKRSYNDNQVERFKASFKDYHAFFALNYKVPFVPVPFTSPMGKVEAGVLTLSRYQPVEVQRMGFPTSYKWPKSLFMLDRCFILSRYKVNNGKELVVLNTHNSAFADAADMRAKELAILKDIITTEYAKGNYVICGGDWNQNPVPYKAEDFADGNKAYAITPGIPSDFLPEGYTWAFDAKHPSNRNVDKAYEKGVTPTTIIDFFVLSPNISLVTCNTLDADFNFSDHQAVGMIVELK